MDKSANAPAHISDLKRFEAALRRFDAENALDPNQEIVDGAPEPRELVYAKRLTAWVLRLDPAASEVLQLAARCQHIARWTIPRNSYPMDRPSYLRWRNDLKTFHARKAGEILRGTGYPEELIQQVQALNLKKNFPTDPESRTLEDALCLVFLEFQFGELASKTDDDKMINALRKSWKKMTEQARAYALKLNFSEKEKDLVQKALI
jgi:hypothetical protein